MSNTNLSLIKEKEKQIIEERLKMEESDILLIQELFSDAIIINNPENTKKEKHSKKK
jgi:hypothetical protein